MEGFETGLAPEVLASFFSKLADVYDRMDKAYGEIAEKTGFCCRGCADNCCETRFYHYTLVELLYLFRGVAALPEWERQRAGERAESLCRGMKQHDGKGKESVFRGLCPLNEEGRCRVYAHRPMICRFHGVPWKMMGRNGEVVAPGCGMFDEKMDEFCLDRTPHYRELALLEKELRRSSGFEGRIRLTIAQMLVLPMPDVGMEGVV
ncbi:YkgJ family cysteine cluster protein [Desulfobotulus sp. H1]|uniref:YkgJ family cysteine cluster protein n=1 Tax=Desulfobotulus pelophilus TaxID=2823377 RepID=A0ABT3NCG5_9BACT|nr:YkgJ family cysteine cluster protein [Desulfobotulus pelophilus]MCW7755168.1 YkgJ family cysteine cluster protein [Desulfobotulus pelophilus]